VKPTHTEKLEEFNKKYYPDMEADFKSQFKE